MKNGLPRLGARPGATATHWTGSNGRAPIAEMGDEHLTNAIRYLLRRAGYALHDGGYSLAGDDGTECTVPVELVIATARTHPSWSGLVREARDRELQIAIDIDRMTGAARRRAEQHAIERAHRELDHAAMRVN